ncbi:TetR/AcrR family transcriptional regulator [Allonocardiopsis opalescens]|uniref:TetR family transcriptional regulator n=1 Tax=Allonocardiopsis opalescens TaxID=1144618 RepID=A0A2T0Q562_9ACTN|nr:TetR/AcrR family transcriptional regulator [Allonocardiopsis opalescens]PRX98975.1 TetR family transcriptional regulator [Allonocardiopsis opalescens]
MSGPRSSSVGIPGTRARTRNAILNAAAKVLARDRKATLADIAKEAEVGRSTLHRYFADREELVNEVVEDSLHLIGQAVEDAALDRGEPMEALRRAVSAMVAVGDRLLFLFHDPTHFDKLEDTEPDATDLALRALIERGQADGVFDPQVAPDWIESVVWALVYSGCEAAGSGALPRHGVTEAVMRTLENGVCAR